MQGPTILSQLPEDWKWAEVSSIAELYRGISYTKDVASNNPFDGALPILRANNINGELNYDDLVYVPQALIKKEQFIKEGDIIFAMSSGSKHLVGKSAVARKDFNGSYGAFCALLRVNNAVNKKYVSYVFKGSSFRKLISEIAKGTNINNLKSEHILTFKIPLPAKQIQNAIVSKIEELFSELDKGIENLRIAQQQLKTYRQAVLKWAFEAKSCCSILFSQIVLSYQNGISKRSASDGKPIKILRLADIVRGEINSVEPRKINLTNLEIDKYGLEKDDIIAIRVNGSKELVGRFIFVDKPDGWGFCDHFIRIKFDRKKVIPKLMKYFSESRPVRKFIELNMVSSAGQNTISQGTLSALELRLPSLGEQSRILQAIERRLSVADKMEETIAKGLEQASVLRQSILKQAF